MIPYGYILKEDGLTLAEAPEERATVARVQAMRELGFSTRRIGSEPLLLRPPAFFAAERVQKGRFAGSTRNLLLREAIRVARG